MVFRIATAVVLVMFAFKPPSINAFSDSTLDCKNTVLLEVDASGNIQRGSKSALINAVNLGEKIRVGWRIPLSEISQLTHWSDAHFISFFNDDVYTQVGAIHRQTPSLKRKNIELSEDFSNWTGLIDSAGFLQGRFHSSDKVMSNRVHSIWCGEEKISLNWKLVYKNDHSGETLFGNKEDLIHAIREGQDVRVAWGVSVNISETQITIEHTANPIFNTIIDGEDVISQLPEHTAQKSYWNISEAEFDKASVLWRGLVSTTGSFDAVWVDRATGTEVKRLKQRAIFSWFVLQIPNRQVNRLALPEGAVLDKE
jgi:hypothetical protein